MKELLNYSLTWATLPVRHLTVRYVSSLSNSSVLDSDTEKVETTIVQYSGTII